MDQECEFGLVRSSFSGHLHHSCSKDDGRSDDYTIKHTLFLNLLLTMEEEVSVELVGIWLFARVFSSGSL